MKKTALEVEIDDPALYGSDFMMTDEALAELTSSREEALHRQELELSIDARLEEEILSLELEAEEEADLPELGICFDAFCTNPSCSGNHTPIIPSYRSLMIAA